jgi:hypothetical protein
MAKLSFGLQFERQYSGPLDVDFVFETTSAMNAYLTAGRRYAGQIATNLEQPGKLFILNNAKDAWLEFSPEGVENINDLGDVTITNLQTNQFLKYNGTAWVNAQGVESVNGFKGIVTLNTDNIAEGSTNKYYPSADASKLAGIEAGAQVNTVDSVNGETGVVELDAADISYDNSASELIAVAVQEAIDELDLKKANINALSSNITLYATNTQSDITEYGKLVTSPNDPDYNSSPINVSTGTITTTDQLLEGSLVSEPGIIVGNPGIITIYTIGNIAKTAGNSNNFAEFFYRLYKRDDLGNEQLLATSDTTGAINPETLNTYFEFNAAALLNNGEFSETDRIVIKFYANALDGTNSAYQFQFGGPSPVRTLLPVPVSVIVADQDASTVLTDTATFAGLLSNADDTVQKALNTLDGVTLSTLGGLSSSDSRIANWDTAYGWGNHADEGYLTSASSLDAAKITGTISASNLPALALTDVHVVNSEAGMIALTAQEGDVAIRTDVNKSFIHNGNTSGTIGDWNELLTPTDAIQSVNGQTGTVSLDFEDVGALSATDARISDWDAAYAYSQIGHLTSVSQSDVTQHQAALSITESQISDLQLYLTSVDISDINTTGTPEANTFLAGDGEWKQIAGAVESVNGETGNVVLTNADLPLEEVEATTDKILQLADSGKLIRFTNSDPAILYVPDEAEINFPLETEIVVLMYGVGQVTFTPINGTVLNFIGEEAVLTQQFTSALLRKIGADEWLLVLPSTGGLAEETDPVFQASEAAKIQVDNAQPNQALIYNGESWVNSDILIEASQIVDIDNIFTLPGEIPQYSNVFQVSSNDWTFDGTKHIAPVDQLEFELNQRPYQINLLEGQVPVGLEIQQDENNILYLVSLNYTEIEMTQQPQNTIIVEVIMDGRNSFLDQPQVQVPLQDLIYDQNFGGWIYELSGSSANSIYVGEETSTPTATNLNEWQSQGMSVNQINFTTVEIQYATSGPEWFFSNAILPLFNFDSTKTSLTTTFTGVDTHEYIFKLETNGGAFAEVSIVANGNQQTAVIDLTTLTEQERSEIDKLVFFAVTDTFVDGTATVSVDSTILQTLAVEPIPYAYTYSLIEDNGQGESYLYLVIQEPDTTTLEGNYSFYPTTGFYEEVQSGFRAVMSINGQTGNIENVVTFDSGEAQQWNEAYSWGNHADQGYLTTDTLPGIAITSTYVVADLTERDALTVEEGDVAIVTGESKTYILTANDGWQEILTPSGGGGSTVTSVNGQIGTVVLDASDVGAYGTSEVDTLLLGKVDVSTFNTYVPDSITEQNNSTATQIWVGTQAQYDAIVTKDANTLYFIEEV